MAKGLQQQKLAVTSGAYPVYRYDPRLASEGKNPLMIDAKEPTTRLEDYVYNETRYRMLLQSDEERAELLLNEAKQDVKSRWSFYQQMAAMHYNGEEEKEN
jgi:pyruvate-ferredoxin/flavodoxin oxidoreductase